MKKLNYWLATALLILVVGCSKVDEQKKSDNLSVDNMNADAPKLKSLGTTNKTKLWPNRVIPIHLDYVNGYFYSADLAQANELFAPTGFKFVKRTNEKDYLYIKDKSSGINFVGKKGGAQPLHINPNFNYRISFYRGIANAIGLYNEYNRKDRIKYITINWDNIKASEMDRFTNIYDDPYLIMNQHFTFESIMMEGSYTSSKNGKPTMIRKSDGKPIPEPNYSKLSATDIEIINTMYRWAGW